MTDKQAADHVTRIIFDAITNAVRRIEEEGSTQNMSQIGPVLLTTGAMVLVQGVGPEVTIKVLKDLSDRVERGDFNGSARILPDPQPQ